MGFRFWVLDSDVSADVVVRGGCTVDLVPDCLAACGFGLGWGCWLGFECVCVAGLGFLGSLCSMVFGYVVCLRMV